MAKKDENAAKQGAKGDRKFKLLLIVASVFLLAAIGAGGYYIGTQWGSESEAAQENTPSSESVSFDSKGELGPLVEMDDFLVNIADGEQTRYLKASITVEATDKKSQDELNKRIPQIRDVIIFHLGTKTFDQVRDLQGKKQLRAELTKRLNGIVDQRLVQRIFFTEFVVQ
ncbi:flagellar basal body-associated FliL family protein [Desulfohalobium retbaense]|uniref:Flagellar protein FliL n=1 Tax=Desulfohalobium retbaense (strain ATCC 49708 / DSM 5692 / JCM 16813 / HR100) TaxID=485915 RepID=C8WYW1_DESRD|nr:flagellar basal body-associated FliL family protein [Desulfohalobium retbaense]ACV67877.1 flagellar basal body-associated protein FliL [Desulfohalobium retbaense DSM 5692]